MLSDRYYMREDYRPERTSFLIWLLCAIVAGFVIQNVFAVWLQRADFELLAALSPGRDILGLERIRLLLERLGNPEQALPPVFHVAGTNGKGSTCAFLRAALEASGCDRLIETVRGTGYRLHA